MVNRPTKGCFGREDLYFAVGVPKTGRLAPELPATPAPAFSRYGPTTRKPLTKSFCLFSLSANTFGEGGRHDRRGTGQALA